MPCTAYAPAPAPEAHFHAAPGGGVYPCKEACPAPEPSNSMHDRLKALEERVAELEEWRNRPRSVR